jgi:putative MATE family efflux protein
MCGRVPNADQALAGLGFAIQLVFLLMVAMMGLSMGCVALVARAHGAGQDDRVEHLLRQSSQLTILLGVAVAVLGNLAADPLLTAMGAHGAAHDEALAYLRPLLTFTVFSYMSFLYAAVLRGVGNTRLPFVVALGANLLNVAINYALILGNLGMPALGVQGAAIGTVVSQVVSVVALVVLLRRGAVPSVILRLRPEPLDMALAGQLFRIGAPAALDMLILNGGFLSIIGMLGRIDPLAVAAHSIGLRIQGLAFVPGLGISQATSAMVGQSLGAGSVPEARQVTRASVALSAAVMSAIAVVILVGARPIVGIFDVAPGSAIESYAITWIVVLGSSMPVVGVHIALTGTLRGAGATGTSLAINAVTTALQVPISFVLGFVLGWGALGVWLGVPIAFVLRALLDLWAYRRGAWARVGVRA